MRARASRTHFPTRTLEITVFSRIDGARVRADEFSQNGANSETNWRIALSPFNCVSAPA